MTYSQGDEARERLRQAKVSANNAAVNARDALYGVSASAPAIAREGADRARDVGSNLEQSARQQASQARDSLDSLSRSAQQQASQAKDTVDSYARSAADEAEKTKNSWFSSARSEADKAKDTARSAANEAEKKSSAWFSSARNEADKAKNTAESYSRSAADEAEKTKNSWFSSAKSEADKAKDTARSAANEAEKIKNSWFSSAKSEADKAKDTARSAAKEAGKTKDSLFGDAHREVAQARDSLDSLGRSVQHEASEAKHIVESYSRSAADEAKKAKDNVYKTASDQASQARNALGDISNRAQKEANNAGDHLDNAANSAKQSASAMASQVAGGVKGLTGMDSLSTDPTAWVPRYGFPDYLRFFSAGALCATITHGAMTPVDVVKTRLQLEPKGSKLGMASMARNIVASEGAAGLMTGFGPTAVGYLIQGGSKFCGFEYFKAKFSIMAGSREAAERHRTLIYIGGASAAEFIASTLLTPLEAARIRLVSTRGYANGLAGAMTRMAREGGFREFYAGYIPILFKQIPFTQAQFTINEYMHELINDKVDPKTIEKAGKTGEVGVSLFCGLMAGVGAAIASHPADTLLSRINKGDGGKGTAFQKMITLTKESGFTGLWAGLGPRLIMQAALICGQMGLYDQIKIALDAPPPVTIAKTGAESSH